MQYNQTKRKIFIITSKDLYSYVSGNLDQIIDLNDLSPLLPYDFTHRNYIDGIIINNSKKHLIKSHDYVMTLPGSELFSREEFETLRNEEAEKRGYKDWLKDKFEYSKEQIDKTDICLIIQDHGFESDEQTKKEIKSEIMYATNKHKPTLTLNINHLNYTDDVDKKFSLHNDKKAA